MLWSCSNALFWFRSFKFVVHRFFRIAPLYYLTIVFYWFFYQESADNFRFELLFEALFFYNAWSPYLIPAVPGWTPVSGDFIFPFLAAWVDLSRISSDYLFLENGLRFGG